MQKATGLASSGSAANSSTSSPLGTRNDRIARFASSDAAEIFGAYGREGVPEEPSPWESSARLEAQRVTTMATAQTQRGALIKL